MEQKIYVGNLSYDITSDELKEAFSEFGNITDVHLPRDPNQRNKGRGFGFVTFDNNEEAKAALKLDGQDVGGRKVRVNIARRREEKGGNRGREESRW